MYRHRAINYNPGIVIAITTQLKNTRGIASAGDCNDFVGMTFFGQQLCCLTDGRVSLAEAIRLDGSSNDGCVL